MKKITCVLAALATLAVAAPTVASAEGFGFRIGSDRDYYRDDYRGPAPDSMRMIVNSTAGGTAMMTATERSWSGVIVTGMTNENGPLTGAIFFGAPANSNCCL